MGKGRHSCRIGTRVCVWRYGVRRWGVIRDQRYMPEGLMLLVVGKSWSGWCWSEAVILEQMALDLAGALHENGKLGVETGGCE